MITIGYPHPIVVSDNNSHIRKNLSDRQFEAVCQRDYLLCRDLGLSLEDYMSLIDPDFK